MITDFNLTTTQLLDIANDLKEKIEKGLKEEGTEIKALPTFIHPKKDDLSGDAVVFDLGGTNFRAATISVNQFPVVKEIAQRNITEMRTSGFSQTDLYCSQLQTISKLNIPKGLPVGYCFSYPAKSLFNGDAELIKWVKGVSIENMEGNAIGKPLLEYLNQNSDFDSNKITVVNDTIASLFSGLMNTGFDAYVGLIVGTGTNMATFYHSENISKLKGLKNWTGETPVNLETGNFSPPHLTVYDEEVDWNSDNPGIQRFEKAVSGMYLGRIFRAAVPDGAFSGEFDGASLTHMINHHGNYKKHHIELAYCIYERSAKLVAASIAGLVKSLYEKNSSIERIQILAEGSLFWSTLNNNFKDYKYIVAKVLNELMNEYGIGKKEAVISKVDNANLVGAAIAVLSTE
jgi:hexokinase